MRLYFIVVKGEKKKKLLKNNKIVPVQHKHSKLYTVKRIIRRVEGRVRDFFLNFELFIHVLFQNKDHTLFRDNLQLELQKIVAQAESTHSIC